MRSEIQIRDLLEQYQFDREIEKEYGIESKKVTRTDLIIYILKWVLDEDNLKVKCDK